MIKPDKQSVQAEIYKLREMKPNVRHYSVFGDDHHAAIDAQVHVLTNDLSEESIYERYDSDEHTETLDSALQARRWMDGDPDSEEGLPSDDWTSLLK